MTTKTEVIISAVDKTKQAIDSATRGLDGLGKRVGALDGILSSFGVGMFSSLAAGLSGGTIAAMIKQTADLQDNMAKAAQKVGVTVESLSGLTYAAELSGIAGDKLSSGLGMLAKNTADFARGTGEAKDAFKALGLSAVDSNGKLKSSDEMLLEIADKFSGMNDGAGKTALAMRLFGDAGRDMIPMLNQGREGIEALRSEAEKLGAVIGDEAAKKAEQFNDNLTRMNTLMRGASIEIGNALIPSLNSLTEKMLAASTAGMSLGEVLTVVVFGTGKSSPFGETVLTRQIEDTKIKIENLKNAGKDYAAELEKLATLQRRLGFTQSAEQAEKNRAALAGFDDNPIGFSVKKKKKKDASDGQKGGGAKSSGRSPADYEQTITERVAAAINNTDIVKAQELESTLRRLDELAAAGLDPEIVKAVRDDLNGSLSDAAKRYKDMIDPLQKYRDQLDEIRRLESAGQLSKDQALEAEFAVQDAMQKSVDAMNNKADAMDKLGSTAKNIDMVITNAFGNAADAIVDFAMGSEVSVGDMVNSMIRDLIRLEIQMQMTNAYKSAGSASGIFGSLFSSLGSFFGPGGTSTSTGSISSAAGGGSYAMPGGSLSAMSFDGGGWTGPGSRSGGLDGKGGFWAMLHPQETVIDHTKGQAGAQSIRVEIRNEGAPQEVASARPSFDAEGMVIEIFTRDIANEGTMSKAMQSRFGLSRAAGAYGR